MGGNVGLLGHMKLKYKRYIKLDALTEQKKNHIVESPNNVQAMRDVCIAET
jgi:hypothetical protein